MKTIRVVQIGAHKVVNGFSQLPIDPEETRKKAIEVLQGTQEQTDLDNKNKERVTNRQKANIHKGKAGAIFQKKVFEISKGDLEKAFSLTRDQVLKEMSQEEKTALDYEEKMMNSYLAADEIINNELGVLEQALKIKQSEIAAQAPVYFEPRLGEIVKPDAEVDELMQKFLSKNENQQLLESGDYIEDFRGTYYFDNAGTWEKKEITELGVVPTRDDIKDSDLTEEQREDIRLQGMAIEEKNAEKAIKIEEAKNSAAHMLNVLTIENDPDPATKARDWYSAEVVKIEAKYS